MLYLPSKLSEAINRHLAMNELHTRGSLRNPGRKEVSLSWLQFICFRIFRLWVRDITQQRLDEKLKYSTKNIHYPSLFSVMINIFSIIAFLLSVRFNTFCCSWLWPPFGSDLQTWHFTSQYFLMCFLRVKTFSYMTTIQLKHMWSLKLIWLYLVFSTVLNHDMNFLKSSGQF